MPDLLGSSLNIRLFLPFKIQPKTIYLRCVISPKSMLWSQQYQQQIQLKVIAKRGESISKMHNLQIFISVGLLILYEAAQILRFIFLERTNHTMHELYLPTELHNDKSADQNPPRSQTNFSERNKIADLNQIHRKPDQNSPQQVYALLENNQKVIPGYNFESLFRKKSHIRLARKKAKEETQKKNPHLKHDPAEAQAKNIQKGHWTNEENKLYHWFLELHNRHFVLKHLRRTDKIFKSMANFIRTRQAEQCRSHHQKMEKKYHTFYQILAKLRMDFYATLNTDLLKIELEEHGYKIKQNTLITEPEIRNGDLLVRDGKSEDIEDSLGIEGQQQSRQDNHSNILGQNYERGLRFGNIHY